MTIIQARREAWRRFGPTADAWVRTPEGRVVYVVNVGRAYGYGKTWEEALNDCKPHPAKSKGQKRARTA